MGVLYNIITQRIMPPVYTPYRVIKNIIVFPLYRYIGIYKRKEIREGGISQQSLPLHRFRGKGGNRHPKANFTHREKKVKI